MKILWMVSKLQHLQCQKRGDDITFLRRIVRGPADDSYGIEVAKLAGLPDDKSCKGSFESAEASALNADRVTPLNFDNFEKFAEKPVPNAFGETFGGRWMWKR